MKKWLLIPLIIVTIVIAFSCSSTIRTANTSLVTISVGSNQTASIKAEPATLMAKLRLFFAKTMRVPSAVAAVPSVVLSIRVTVSAPDMPTVTITEPVLGQEVVIITIEIPNGNGRVFLVEGLNSSAAVSYWGEFTANLAGGSFSQAVDMLFVGSALSYLYVDNVNGNNANPGTRSSPLMTITRALSLTNGNTAIFIQPGLPYDVKNGETFPLTLILNTALVCLGNNFTTVVDNSTGAATTINGASGAVVNGCRINAAQVPTSIAINDNGAAMTIISSLVSGGTSTTLSASTCIALRGGSRVAKSTITGCSFNSSGVGISISGGNPTIEFNTITGNVGTGVSVSGGIPIIQGNDIRTNTTGLSIASVSPIVTNNAVHSNGTGIFVSGSTANPTVSGNSIYCNTAVDLNASGTTILLVSLNSWDHDLTTVPTGPTIGVVACTAGTDICGGTLTYTPFNVAVPGGCLVP